MTIIRPLKVHRGVYAPGDYHKYFHLKPHVDFGIHVRDFERNP